MLELYFKCCLAKLGSGTLSLWFSDGAAMEGLELRGSIKVC